MAIIFNRRNLIIIGLALLCSLIAISAVYGAVQFYLKHIKATPFEVSQLDRTERKVDHYRLFVMPTPDGFEKAMVKKDDHEENKGT